MFQGGAWSVTLAGPNPLPVSLASIEADLYLRDNSSGLQVKAAGINTLLDGEALPVVLEGSQLLQLHQDANQNLQTVLTTPGNAEYDGRQVAIANANTPTITEGAATQLSVNLKGRQRIQHLADRVTNNTGVDAFVDSVAPHTIATRGTYTVPANTISIVKGIHISIERETAATVAGIITADVRQATGATRLLSLRTSTNNLLARLDQSIALDFQIPATEQIILEDTDTSTGGAVSFDYNVVINEYSA